MLKYIGKRLLLLIPILICVAILVFSITYFTPGDPIDSILGGNAKQEQIDALRAELGLDQPFIKQLGNYLVQTFAHFDLGTSYVTHKDVFGEIVKKLPYSMIIAFGSVMLGVIFGVPLGIISATNQFSWQDNASMFLAMFFVSMPDFWFALILVQIFANKLGWLPSVGASRWVCYIMPCLSLAVTFAANLARQTRSGMLEVIRQDYITTARAKGLKEKTVITKHALKNALIPIITVVGGQISAVIGGSVIAETIFSIPGIGAYILEGIMKRDFPIVRGCVLVIAVMYTIVMLLVDLSYAAVSPQIRSQYK